MTNEQGRHKNDYQQKQKGKNYDRDYLSGGSLNARDDIFIQI